MKTLFVSLLLSLGLTCVLSAGSAWISLFDGETFTGWKPNENPNTWWVENGEMVCRGERSHLFYVGDVADHDFINFELSLDVKSKPHSNSGVYVHTQWQDEGWPAAGYEAQVWNTTVRYPDGYTEHKMSGSIYAVQNVWKAVVADNEWYNFRIKVTGNRIRTYINGELIADYSEPEQVYREEDKPLRFLSSGTFALQGHDPGSQVHFKNIKVKVLPDDLVGEGTTVDDYELDKKILYLSDKNYPLIDLTYPQGSDIEEMLEHSRLYGFTPGVLIDDTSNLFDTLRMLKPYPQVYVGYKVTGNTIPSHGNFTYIMNYFDYFHATIQDGDDVVARVSSLADSLVSVISFKGFTGTLSSEDQAAILEVMAKNGTTLEVNNSGSVVDAVMLAAAKEAGVKVSMGAGGFNSMEGCVDTVIASGIAWEDMYVPNK